MSATIRRPEDDSFSEFERFLKEGLGEENFDIEYGENDEIIIRTKLGHDMGGIFLINEEDE